MASDKDPTQEDPLLHQRLIKQPKPMVVCMPTDLFHILVDPKAPDTIPNMHFPPYFSVQAHNSGGDPVLNKRPWLTPEVQLSSQVETP